MELFTSTLGQLASCLLKFEGAHEKLFDLLYWTVKRKALMRQLKF